MNTEVARNEDGTFPTGVSGNPAGRPKGSKNLIVKAKQDLELAIRKNVTPKQIKTIVDKMVDLAADGNVQAAKLILDKTISNAKVEDEDNSGTGGIQIIITNATVKSLNNEDSAVDAEFTEVTEEE